MDAITQGVLGAAAAQALLSRRLGKRTWLYGALGGMAPDLDIFIRSAVDPLVAIEYHRNFTHSLAFIPIGGLLVALPWILREKHRHERLAIVLATTAGWATHGLLDAFTSYGTMLWWPLSRERVAWSWISIVDLGYTLPLIVGVILAARRVAARPARLALLLSSLYMAFCGLQRARVLSAQGALIAHRGHHAARVDAFPSLANNVTWRSIYEADGAAHVDKIRAPWFGATRVIAGGAAPLVDLDELPEVAADPTTRRAFEVFAWFSAGWLIRDPGDPERIGDLRYALRPGDLQTMWAVRLDPGAAAPVIWESPGADRRDISVGDLWTVLFEDGGEPLLLGNTSP